MNSEQVSNSKVADILESVADLLEIEGSGSHLIKSYRQTATKIRHMHKAVAALIEEKGFDELKHAKGIDNNLIPSIDEIVRTGCLGYLEQLKKEVDIESASDQSPEIVQNIRGRIYSGMGTEPLEELNLGPHDQKLDETNALGGRRVHGESNAMSDMYNVSELEGGECSEAASEEIPSVDLLLEVDAEYRKKASSGELKKLAPEKNNPENKKWLPMLEVQRRGWNFRLLFSNTDLAHQLDKIFDWVVIHYQNDVIQDQCTVVTSGIGPLAGHRVIRGREEECQAYYETRNQAKSRGEPIE